MTDEEAKKMLKAKLECLKNETSGINHDCNMRLCDGCSLNYEQGNMGEQKEALDKAIKTLEQTRWIPVEDDLPKEDELVMVTMERDGHRTTTKAIYYSGSLFWNDYVTAWMPYIEPYNAESEDKE